MTNSARSSRVTVQFHHWIDILLVKWAGLACISVALRSCSYVVEHRGAPPPDFLVTDSCFLHASGMGSCVLLVGQLQFLCSCFSHCYGLFLYHYFPLPVPFLLCFLLLFFCNLCRSLSVSSVCLLVSLFQFIDFIIFGNSANISFLLVC